MAENTASFCSCAENLKKDEFKDDGWICLDISRQDGFQAGEEEAAVTEKSVHHTIIECPCTALGERNVS